MDDKRVRELISKDLFVIKDGRITLFRKIDYIMYPSRGIAVNFQRIGKDFGINFLFDLGYKTGLTHWEEISTTLNSIQKFLPSRLNSIFLIMEMTGQGKIEILEDTKNKIVIKLINNPSINHSKDLFGKNSLVCYFYAGLYSAILSKEREIPKLRLNETKCITKGDSYCEFVYKK